MGLATENSKGKGRLVIPLVRCLLVAAVVVAGFAAVQVANADTTLPDCPARVDMPTDPPPDVRAIVQVQNAIADECEASAVRAEVAQSVAHQDSWYVLGILGALIVAVVFVRVVFR